MIGIDWIQLSDHFGLYIYMHANNKPIHSVFLMFPPGTDKQIGWKVVIQIWILKKQKRLINFYRLYFFSNLLSSYVNFKCFTAKQFTRHSLLKSVQICFSSILLVKFHSFLVTLSNRKETLHLLPNTEFLPSMSLQVSQNIMTNFPARRLSTRR